MVSTLEQMQVPNGTGPGVRRSKRPLLANDAKFKLLVFLHLPNFYCTLLYIYIATILHLTAEPRGRPAASSMYHIIFIKTENIVVDKIGRNICSHLLVRAQ